MENVSRFTAKEAPQPLYTPKEQELDQQFILYQLINLLN